MFDIYFEILTVDGNYFCKGNTREKELEKTLWAHPNAEVITWNAKTHKILLDKQPLRNICKPWEPPYCKSPIKKGVIAGYQSE